ncbi:MAG TPA: hypothetical protein PLC79_03285 [Phycisphaerae bacterium]|nr:hypothetical protein [Phycisphaerae bacterium]
MKAPRRFVRTGMMVALGVLVVGVMGAQCSITLLPPPVEVPVVTTVDIVLVNNTPDPVDPGLFVDGVLHVFDPPLAPGESVALTVNCFADTTLQTDAFLLDAAGDFESQTAPLLVEGQDFFCGDAVTFTFVLDAAGFFTQADVNGVLLVP